MHSQRAYPLGSASLRATLGLTAAALMAALFSAPLAAQTIEDGIMLSRQSLCTGALYTHDSWEHYWEGSLERTNGNIGTVTTQSVIGNANYGLTNRINLIGQAPLIWTNTSQGVLRSQHSFQDLTLAAKVDALKLPVRQFATLRAFGVLSGTTPLTNYDPTLQPLALGTHARTLTPRVTLNLQSRSGVYVNGTIAYVFRGKTTLDQPYYYTNNQLTNSSEVALPNQFSYATAVGYYKRDLKIEGSFRQMQTRGGGDIRRQDLPFVSNRMNYSRIGGTVQYPLPKRLHHLQYWFTDENTLQGRNVGHSNTITTGFMYVLQFERSPRS